MLTPQFVLPLATKLVVDLFAGGGGASTGLEQAIGRHVDIAVNHDPIALAMHRANHPQTKHFASDVFEVDPREVTDGQEVGLLWASPDCTFHSKARGGKPFRDTKQANRRRSLAWVVVKWAKLVKPDVILLENVEEFQHWGPLDDAGQPCKQRKGQTFQRWVAQLRNLGYAVQWKELRACDYGAPTIRKRLFLVARCDGQPIMWPSATHGKKGSGLKAYRTAADCIDWSLPCPSIFERDRPLAEATQRRIAHGIKRYVLDDPHPFIARIGQTGGRGSYTSSISEPLSTITSKAEHLMVSPTLASIGYGERDGQAPRVPGLDKPLGTIVGAKKHALVAAYLAKHFGGKPEDGKTCASLERPAPTVTARDHSSLVTSNLVKLRGTSNSAATGEPLGTISAGGQHHAEVRAFLIRYFGTEQDPRLTDPLGTITTKHRDAIVTVAGEDYAIVDIGLRMLQPRELYRAQGFPEAYIIDWGMDEDGRRIELTKEAQVRMCGNSVCPPLSRAIAAANYSEAGQVRRAA